MKGVLARFLVLGVPGLCVVIVGALSDAYPVIAVGGIILIDAVYGLSRNRGVKVDDTDQKRQRRSFILASVIGTSFAITGFVGHSYWLGVVGTVILIGSLLQLYHTMPGDAR